MKTLFLGLVLILAFQNAAMARYDNTCTGPERPSAAIGNTAEAMARTFGCQTGLQTKQVGIGQADFASLENLASQMVLSNLPAN